MLFVTPNHQGIAPGAVRRYAPANGSSTRGGSTSVRIYLAAGGGYATGSQRAYSLGQLRAYGSCALKQTDGQTD